MLSLRDARVSLCLFAALACCLAILTAGCNQQEPPPAAQATLPSNDELLRRLDDVIEFTGTQRHLNTTDHAAWQVVHGALAYGRDFNIFHERKLVPAWDYLLAGGQLRGWNMRKADHGVQAILEAGSKTGQGHEDQWLGYLSQAGLAIDESIVVGGEKYTVRDLVTQAQWDVHDGMEATWTLMAFSNYLPLDAKWTASDGTEWSIDRLVRMETAQDLAASACGGSHRIYGLTVARNRYLASGGKLTDNPEGVWEKCDQKIRDAIASAREFQQPDGSFSANYFSRAAAPATIADRIGSTGHVLEFLTVALDDQQLKEPWVTRAVNHLVGCLEKTKQYELECGALYHAAHGLDLYRLRRFGPRKEQPGSPVAFPPVVVAAE